jgi:hypothetical protein
LFVLSLASHEASLIIWFALAFQLFDRRGFLQFLVISVSYLLLLFSFNDGISGVLSTRGVGGVSNIMWVINFPLKEILGILLSYKAMWIIVISAICYLWTRRDYKEIFQILLVLCMGVVLTFMGVDTSRLFGWTFMAILASWRILAHSEGNWRKLIDPILLINFAVPSVNILLILEPSFAPGFYQIAFRYFFNH